MTSRLTEHIDAQVRYLLALPLDANAPAVSPQSIQGLRDAPYFAPVDIDVQPLSAETIELHGVRVTVRRTVYAGAVLLAECAYDLSDALNRTGQQTKLRVQSALRGWLLADRPDVGDLIEEYTVLLIARTVGTPDEFVERNGPALARFIRSQREVFTRAEMQDTLVSRVHYSEDELTLVDWEGAVIISSESDFQSDVELLKIGNYQLLRYRMLDRLIEQSLTTVSRHMEEGARSSLLPSRSKRMLRQVVEKRLLLTLEFEKVKEALLLIGDWYTAKLYRVIYDEFYLDDWEAVIRSKLSNLESILQVIQENFEFSWTRFLEMVQIAGWLLLLLGYFVLFFLDLRAYQ